MRSLSILWGYNAWWLLNQVFPDLVGFFSCSQFLQCASYFLLIFTYAAAMLDTMRTGPQYIYVSTCVPCLSLRFDIELGFIPQLALLLLSAREAIVNQTRTPSYLCLVILLTKF